MSTAMKLATTDMTEAEWETRCNLAALYHVVHDLGWTDLINTPTCRPASRASRSIS